MEILKIKKGGKLIKTKWVYDDEKGEGEYQDFDVTENAIRFLFEPCELDKNVTLKDIFLLLNSELYIFDAVLGNWCEEIIKEGLNNPEKPHDLSKYDPDQIEYLELSLSGEYDDQDFLCGLNRPDLRGVGVELREDSKENFHRKGERISWGVSLTPANELINIPVKLNPVLVIRNGILRGDGFEELARFKNTEFTLGQILNGIIWELSFHGDPTDRAKFVKELKESAESIKEELEATGELDSKSLENVEKVLKEKIKE